MRTSKLSQDTTRIFNALSGNARIGSTRATRSSKRISTFALGYDGSVQVTEEDTDQLETPSSTAGDIEDGLATPPPSYRKRKRGSESPPSTPVVKSSKVTRVKTEVMSPTFEAVPAADTPKQKAKPKIPAKRKLQDDGTYVYTPPSNWSEIYSIVKAQRERNPTAPVDTMGCEDLYWRTSPPAQKRYHTLVALMLSSQTKDTVTAAAMQRLHTELNPSGPLNAAGKPENSSLTVENMISATPQHLDSLICKVGFHNNKTRYLKQTAEILREKFDSDIPNTLEGLTSLPGVGPKMAFLCLSGAWGYDLG